MLPEPVGAWLQCALPSRRDVVAAYLSGYASWSDPEYDRISAAATSAPDAALRMNRLSTCEKRLLGAMPFVPLYFDNWVYLERPVRALRLNLLGAPCFKIRLDRRRPEVQ